MVLSILGSRGGSASTPNPSWIPPLHWELSLCEHSCWGSLGNGLQGGVSSPIKQNLFHSRSWKTCINFWDPSLFEQNSSSSMCQFYASLGLSSSNPLQSTVLPQPSNLHTLYLLPIKSDSVLQANPLPVNLNIQQYIVFIMVPRNQVRSVLVFTETGATVWCFL